MLKGHKAQDPHAAILAQRSALGSRRDFPLPPWLAAQGHYSVPRWVQMELCPARPPATPVYTLCSWPHAWPCNPFHCPRNSG